LQQAGIFSYSSIFLHFTQQRVDNERIARGGEREREREREV
jgi:hypothetical protein